MLAEETVQFSMELSQVYCVWLYSMICGLTERFRKHWQQ